MAADYRALNLTSLHDGMAIRPSSDEGGGSGGSRGARSSGGTSVSSPASGAH